MSDLDLRAVNPAALLAALYNRSRPQGLGFIQYVPGDMSVEDAQNILNESRSKYFDYLKGRVMKVDLSGPTVDTFDYNRDNGENAAEQVYAAVLAGHTSTPALRKHHEDSTVAAARDMRDSLHTPSVTDEATRVIQLGVDDKIRIVVTPKIADVLQKGENKQN